MTCQAILYKLQRRRAFARCTANALDGQDYCAKCLPDQHRHGVVRLLLPPDWEERQAGLGHLGDVVRQLGAQPAAAPSATPHRDPILASFEAWKRKRESR